MWGKVFWIKLWELEQVFTQLTKKHLLDYELHIEVMELAFCIKKNNKTWNYN
jgi:hypothetical protein